MIAACADKAFFAEVFPLSARRGENVRTCVESLVGYLPEGARYFPEDMPTDRDERFLIAELIREQAILHTHEEVPYAIAVKWSHSTSGLRWVALRSKRAWWWRKTRRRAL